jgi:hypothetical protein
MSASGDRGVGEWTSRLQEIASVNEGSWTNVVPKTLLLPFIAFLTSVADAIGAILGIPINIADATAEAGGDLVDAVFGGSAQIIDTGAIVSANSLQEGVWAQFGPLTFTIGIGAVVAAAYIWARSRGEEETSNWFVFLPDLPGPFGAEEEDEG